MAHKKDTAVNATNSIIEILAKRFVQHKDWYPDLDWKEVAARLNKASTALAIVARMEESGGEPAIAGLCDQTGALIIYDCAIESPKERRSVCYDKQAWDERKEHKPGDNAIDMAANIGASIMDENIYKHLQSLGNFDLKTSSWLATPPAIRQLGGAIFGDKRYNQVFIYHNGASSYYAARGFRTYLYI